MVKQITILKAGLASTESSDTKRIISLNELRKWIIQGTIIKHFFRYQQARLLFDRLDVIPKPFLMAILLRFLARREYLFEDEQGQRLRITARLLCDLLLQLITDLLRKRQLIRDIYNEVDRLATAPELSAENRLDLSTAPVYLRTDLAFGVRSGGSIGHIAGVLNNLDQFAGRPLFLTTDTIPTVRNDLEVHCINPGNSFWDFKGLPTFYFNKIFEKEALKLLDGKRLSFIYQRYSINNYSGIKLARHYSIPFVLEYNGSEIWIGRHWARPLIYEALSERIEILNLRAADIVVVVSRPMKDELVSRGIDANKILVNPNGVNPQRYSPDVDGSDVRKRFSLHGKTVIGFIGTFGRWHGAEVLAEAFGTLLQEFPEYQDRVRLLMIGDGPNMYLVKENLSKFNVADSSILTGLVPQDEGPAYLAACDILASPHVPNPDGTPFFGSPTKLFEYMAMGKGIVASDLDQIGEIVEHDRTGWMVKPGDVRSLMLGLKKLIDDQGRRIRLGQAARREVIAKYTWREHTSKIIDKLKERCQ